MCSDTSEWGVSGCSFCIMKWESMGKQTASLGIMSVFLDFGGMSLFKISSLLQKSHAGDPSEVVQFRHQADILVCGHQIWSQMVA